MSAVVRFIGGPAHGQYQAFPKLGEFVTMPICLEPVPSRDVEPVPSRDVEPEETTPVLTVTYQCRIDGQGNPERDEFGAVLFDLVPESVGRR